MVAPIHRRRDAAVIATGKMVREAVPVDRLEPGSQVSTDLYGVYDVPGVLKAARRLTRSVSLAINSIKPPLCRPGRSELPRRGNEAEIHGERECDDGRKKERQQTDRHRSALIGAKVEGLPAGPRNRACRCAFRARAQG